MQENQFDLPSLMLPAPLNGGFAMKDYWVWCGSVIRGEDGRYHMFASRWSKEVSFLHWVLNSEVVRATSDRPEGPFRFEQVVLEQRPGYFDGRVTHTPCIQRCGDTYLLFYTGTTYDGPTPTHNDQADQPSARWQQAWHNKRIGMATAKSVLGPWVRTDRPLLDVRPGHWDSVITSNPAPCVHADGRVLLLYKSTPHRHDADGMFRGRFMLGAAWADHYSLPFRRLSDEPILQFNHPDAHVEDPFCWYDGSKYRAIMKDMTGVIGGEPQAGIATESEDGVNWRLSDPAQAYRRLVHWEDGSVTRPAKLERPQLLIENGRPTHFYAATCDSEISVLKANSTWSMVIPLRTA